MTKAELRKSIRERAENTSFIYRVLSSDTIADAVLGSEQYRKADTIFVYVSLQYEPSTDRIILRALYDGKRVCIPKCYEKPNMVAVQVKQSSEIAPGYMGILEPTDQVASDPSRIVSPQEIDLALIPCVSADRSGARLGHGAAFYDTFLRKSGAYKMCLCFEELICKEGVIPVEEHDIMMDKVVTEC